MNSFRLAILDLYDGTPNQGMRCIKEIVGEYEREIAWELFDVRGKAAVPNVEDFDLFICSGGPGSPLDGDGVWDRRFFEFIDAVCDHNERDEGSKKYLFFICHSFEMACHHFGLAEVVERKSMSFGTFPVHPTDAALDDFIFRKLDNPFYVADFREWQVIQPDLDRFAAMGAEILCLEKIRPDVPLERAIMGIRFSEEIVGVQFHPEADPDGMLRYFREEERLVHIINTYGKKKYAQMIRDLTDPGKIQLTHNIVLPAFIEESIGKLKKQTLEV